MGPLHHVLIFLIVLKSDQNGIEIKPIISIQNLIIRLKSDQNGIEIQSIR